MQSLTQAVMSATVARLAEQLWQRHQIKQRHQRRGLLVVVMLVRSDELQLGTSAYPTTTYYVARDDLEPFLSTANIVPEPDTILTAVDSCGPETAAVLIVSDTGCGLYYVNERLNRLIAVL